MKIPFDKLRSDFNHKNIINAFLLSIAFSGFIYLHHFELQNRFVETLLAIGAVYLFLTSNRPTLFYGGFSVGILWFYWVGFSFRFYDLTYLIPLVILFFAILYGVLFLAMGWIKHPFARVVGLYLIAYVALFDFDWFRPSLMLINTYFGSSDLHFVLLATALATTLVMHGKMRLIALIPFIFLLSYSTQNTHFRTDTRMLSVKLVDTQLPQDQKWEGGNQNQIIENNLAIINTAIKEQHEVVLLPEVAFPLVLERDRVLVEILKEKSRLITIVTGALKHQQGHFYNSTYVFENGEMSSVNKHLLVPLGEYIPMPGLIRDFINETFYKGAQDYIPADRPQDVMLRGVKFRNAICYEATSRETYQDNPSWIVASSNNAWFTPSIEPTLQNLLIRQLSRQHGTIVYHSANMGKVDIIKPE